MPVAKADPPHSWVRLHFLGITLRLLNMPPVGFFMPKSLCSPKWPQPIQDLESVTGTGGTLGPNLTRVESIGVFQTSKAEATLRV